MAHSNHYFRMENKLSPDRHVDLISRGPEYGEPEEVFDNMIQIVVKGPIYGTSDVGEIGIYLTEQEQDDLIAGILERRGLVKVKTSAPGNLMFSDAIAGGGNPVSSDGQEQSKIWPNK